MSKSADELRQGSRRSVPKIFIPTNGADDWRNFLADPEVHWRAGYSARAIANCWEATNGLPREIAELLCTHPDFSAMSPELLVAFPEWKVPLPGGRRASQNDVFALVRIGEQTLSMAVEGKVSETFGPLVSEWMSEASDGKQTRLSFLCNLIGLQREEALSLRYQLLHRTASAIIERRRFGMTSAAVVVHSFSQANEWFDDFAVFVRRLGQEAKASVLSKVTLPSGEHLYLGWAKGNERFLAV